MEAVVFFGGIKDERGKTLTVAEIAILLFRAFPKFCGAANEFGLGTEFSQSAVVALGGVPPRVGG